MINEIHLFASLCGEYAAEVGFGALELVLRQDIELLLDTGQSGILAPAFRRFRGRC